MGTVGTWDWAQETNGRLRRRDRAYLLWKAALGRLAAMPAPLRAKVVPDGGPLELPDPPDSALARLAEERVRELSAPPLYGHCLRTWAFAALFGKRERIEHDPELLYLACVMHDLGIAEEHDRRDPTAACFAVEGARAAHGMLLANAAPPDRARTVAEAISLHLNVFVPERLGVEAYLLGKGVSLDVTGMRLRELPRPAIARVVKHWPREGSGAWLVGAMRQQAEARPQSRAALLMQAGFARLTERCPLDRPAP
jgi:HD domain